MREIESWARALEKERDRFLESPVPRRSTPRPPACPPTSGYRVELIVRTGRLSPDTLFVHESPKVSRLEARIDAERAARAAGWPVVGRVHQVVRL